MKINIYPIVSSLHEDKRINKDTEALLNELMNESKHQFSLVNIDELYDADLSLILIQSGGSEQLFLNNLNKLKAPFYLLTYGNNNSLAASLEILSYIKDHNLDGEVLHGSNKYISERIDELLSKLIRFGVLGKPSDWLIASNINYQDALRMHNIELIDLPIERVIKEYNLNLKPVETDNFNYDKEELYKALRLNNALENIVKSEHLDGLTIRCFSILEPLKTTACLGLALLNKKGLVATCEGDIPTLISMAVLKKVTGQIGFQANPSRIDLENRKIILAHCTLPLDMAKEYYLTTHFESGIGVAIKGYLKEEKVTIFKLSRNLKDYYVETGRILRNLESDNLCRTQIEIQMDGDLDYFFSRPYGNHHVIIYGDHKEELIKYMERINR